MATSASVAIVIFTLTTITLLLSFSPIIGYSQFSFSPSSANQAGRTGEHEGSPHGPSSNKGNTIPSSLPLNPTWLLLWVASITIRPQEQLLSAVVQLDLQISITNSMIPVSLLSNLQMACGF